MFNRRKPKSGYVVFKEMTPLTDDEMATFESIAAKLRGVNIANAYTMSGTRSLMRQGS